MDFFSYGGVIDYAQLLTLSLSLSLCVKGSCVVLDDGELVRAAKTSKQ